MNTVAFLAAVIVGLMLAEWRLSRANERWLAQAGAVRPPGDPYVALAILYPAAFVVMSGEGLWRASAAQSADPSGGPAWAVSGALLLLGSKALKYWAIGSLGPRWSFGVWVLPGSALVQSGPYMYLAHPNYVAVVGELISTAMMMKAILTGPVVIPAFGLALLARMRFESRVLATMARTDAAVTTSEGRG